MIIHWALRLKMISEDVFSLALAYTGDAVYELSSGTMVINHGSIQVNKTRRKKSVSAGHLAGTQAEMILILKGHDSCYKKKRSASAVYKRDENAKSVQDDGEAIDFLPDRGDYRTATGFEALFQ